jgi:hypothetical protein
MKLGRAHARAMVPPSPSPPESLRAVSEAVRGGTPFALAAEGFVSSVAARARRVDGGWEFPRSAWSEAPIPLADRVSMAWMGGMAEHLAQSSSERPPAWCAEDAFFLPLPVFVCEHGTEDAVRVSTPSSLVRRNLFCGRVLARIWDDPRHREAAA